MNALNIKKVAATTNNHARAIMPLTKHDHKERKKGTKDNEEVESISLYKQNIPERREEGREPWFIGQGKRA